MALPGFPTAGGVPLVPIMSAPGITLTRTTLRENLTHAEIQHSTLRALEERFHPDGLFTFMDLTVEAECLGLAVSFPEHAPPSIRVHPVKDAGALEALEEGWSGIGGRMRVFLATMEKISRTSACLHLGHITGPLTLAGELMGVGDMALSSIQNAEFLCRMLSFTGGVAASYGQAMLDAGADLLTVLEPTGVIFSPAMFDTFCCTPFRALQRALKGRCILHVCGKTTPLLKVMAGSGAFGLSLDSGVDFTHASAVIPADMYLIGNIDPVGVFLKGTPPDVERTVSELLARMKGRSGFILSSGCDLPSDVPMENLQAFFLAGRES
jgi:uroporphyrinogen decarboxylase